MRTLGLSSSLGTGTTGQRQGPFPLRTVTSFPVPTPSPSPLWGSPCAAVPRRIPSQQTLRRGRVAHSVLEGGGWSRKGREEASSQSTAGSWMDPGPGSTDSPEARLGSSGWAASGRQCQPFPACPGCSRSADRGTSCQGTRSGRRLYLLAAGFM